MAIIFSKLLSYLYLSFNWIKKAFKSLFIDSLSIILALIALVINFIAWLGAYFLFRLVGSELVVLHYNVVFGVDLVGNAGRLFLIPLEGLIILLINIFLGALLFKGRDKILSIVLLSLAIIINIFCLIALYFSYIVNFS